MKFEIGQAVTYVKKEVSVRKDGRFKEYRDPAVVENIHPRTVEIKFTNGYRKCVNPKYLEPFNTAGNR